MSTLKINEDEPIQYGLLSRVIESAQKKVEAYNFEIRKNLLEFDNVLEKQREVIYRERDKIFKQDTVKDEIIQMLDDILIKIVNAHYPEGAYLENEPAKEIEKSLTQLLNKRVLLNIENNINKETLIHEIRDIAIEIYEEKEKVIGPDLMRRLEKYILLYSIDSNWKDHLYAMDELKEGIGLRAYGQKDPLIEYQIEGHALFDNMMESIKEDTIRTLFRVELKKEEQEKEPSFQNQGHSISKEERKKRREEEKKAKKKRKR